MEPPSATLILYTGVYYYQPDLALPMTVGCQA